MFTLKWGNVQYQRTNFPLSLAYALTAHKCQGETLDEVIIDFGPDKELGLRNYVCAGSFYVALTRVREGAKVFLRSFDQSYIVVNHKIEEKIESMRKFNNYKMKKIYPDEQIFVDSECELNFGFLNINGLLDGKHCEYLNEDQNLIHIDILVLEETKLESTFKSSIIETLFNWDIIGRFDADDKSKHMGLLLISPNRSNIRKKMKTVTYQPAKRNGDLQIQGIIVRMMNGLSIGFIYCRSTPNNPEIKAINKYFAECKFLLGDFNLSLRNPKDVQKLEDLCKKDKFISLKEITRIVSNNQVDHILADKIFEGKSYSTSYFNFISDHKSIVMRVTINSTFTDEALERILFDSEHHLRGKVAEEETSTEDPCYLKRTNNGFELKRQAKSQNKTEESSESVKENISNNKNKKIKKNIAANDLCMKFTRRFMNPDMSTCWLNSCLQLILSGFDHFYPEIAFQSNLGLELMVLKNIQPTQCIDPTVLKNIIVYAEDTRIATRKSELTSGIKDKDELAKMLENVDEMYLNFNNRQQCVRDFFICLNENMEDWLDVHQTFSFTTINLSICISCGHKSESEQNQIYLEMDISPDGANLSQYVEETFNEGLMVDYNCEDGCQTKYQAEKRTVLKSVRETQFIIILLRRSIMAEQGIEIVYNNVYAEGNIQIR